jgi:hypothetical protein
MISAATSKKTIQAPCMNLVTAMMTVAIPVVTAPIPFTISFYRQCSPFLISQRRTNPAWDKVNETKTPIA